MKGLDLTNIRFGRLVAISEDQSKSRSAYLCVCDCGNKKAVMRQSLVNGATKSCGCIKKKYNHPEGYDPKTYRLWHSIIRRCYNKKTNGYQHYKNKGVTVCDRWQGVDGFVNFMEDMKDRPTESHTIDRIDNNGIYEPKNCRWTTIDVQANNRSNNVPVTIGNKTLNIAQWARVYGINSQTIHERRKRGWDDIKAITKPI